MAAASQKDERKCRALLAHKDQTNLQNERKPSKTLINLLNFEGFHFVSNFVSNSQILSLDRISTAWTTRSWSLTKKSPFRLVTNRVCFLLFSFCFTGCPWDAMLMLAGDSFVLPFLRAGLRTKNCCTHLHLEKDAGGVSCEYGLLDCGSGFV